uniref:Uncharacterized protein n=1 Tax=uncultured marine virus TaxID=186617 RepID=A0A0F7L556_9VIRU|nr:hypothetical protein [uncultured marine virus]
MRARPARSPPIPGWSPACLDRTPGARSDAARAGPGNPPPRRGGCCTCTLCPRGTHQAGSFCRRETASR